MPDTRLIPGLDVTFSLIASSIDRSMVRVIQEFRRFAFVYSKNCGYINGSRERSEVTGSNVGGTGRCHCEILGLAV